jgi:hypothetical protein
MKKRILIVIVAAICLFTIAGIAAARVILVPRVYHGHIRHHGHPGAHCFIATASFGQNDPSVSVLQEFRDRYLASNSAGQAFVDLYYRNSPPVADYIAQNEWAKTLVRSALTPVVGFCYLANLAG